MPGGVRSASLQDYVAANARRFREGLALTQEVAAGKVGVSPRRYRAFEQGQVNLTLVTLGLLADALEVEAHQLLRPAQHQKRGPGRPKKRSKAPTKTRGSGS